MSDDQKGSPDNNNNDNGYFIGDSCYTLRKNHFKILHISSGAASVCPTEQVVKELLQLTNDNYEFKVLQDKNNLPDTLYDDYDVLLLTTYCSIDVTRWGNLTADAVDAGKNVVILLFANSASYTHPKARFMTEHYNATTRVGCQSIDSTLGTVRMPNHPIMTNVKVITLAKDKRRSMGKIPNDQIKYVDRIADWKDGNVFIAIRHNKPGLITEITCCFGTGGGQGDAKQLLNNALRLDRKLISMSLINVISNSNFGIIQKIQQQFTSDEMTVLQKNSNFPGCNNVYNGISIQFAAILNSAFNKISKQINNATQQQIDRLTTKKNNCLKEIENNKIKYKELNFPDKTIQDAQAPLLQYVKTLETEINKWKNKQTNVAKLINTKK